MGWASSRVAPQQLCSPPATTPLLSHVFLQKTSELPAHPSPPLLTLTWAASPAGPWPRAVAHSCSGPWRWQLPQLEAPQDPTDRRTSAHTDPWDQDKPGMWRSSGPLRAWSPLQLAVGMACKCPSLHRISMLTQGSSPVIYMTQPSTQPCNSGVRAGPVLRHPWSLCSLPDLATPPPPPSRTGSGLEPPRVTVHC